MLCVMLASCSPQMPQPPLQVPSVAEHRPVVIPQADRSCYRPSPPKPPRTVDTFIEWERSLELALDECSAKLGRVVEIAEGG